MIQIDMPMPTNCLVCPACNEYLTCAIPINGRKWGENDVSEYGQGRPKWCPLKEQEAVVRCKYCKHRPKKPNYETYENGFDIEFPEGSKCPCLCSDDRYYSWYPVDDWYCANGERKDGGVDA